MEKSSDKMSQKLVYKVILQITQKREKNGHDLNFFVCLFCFVVVVAVVFSRKFKLDPFWHSLVGAEGLPVCPAFALSACASMTHDWSLRNYKPKQKAF